ncbi:hypothetical protein [Tropicimonas isoalkanivorans]|uniref:hypothetical protein n=1 Tax=Tropicimonas isoalkanivorans TaxID=441112 RepID=UPI0015A4EF21|nr:hypothetical protein [Tropicimonas isoalkanivorans]
MIETNDEWGVACRHAGLETLARITDHPIVRLPAVVARPILACPKADAHESRVGAWPLEQGTRARRMARGAND